MGYNDLIKINKPRSGLFFQEIERTVPKELKYFYRHHNSNRVWGVYCTYYQRTWALRARPILVDYAILFYGVDNKIRYKVCDDTGRIEEYRQKRIKQGYVEETGNINELYPEIYDKITKSVFWHELGS